MPLNFRTPRLLHHVWLGSSRLIDNQLNDSNRGPAVSWSALLRRAHRVGVSLASILSLIFESRPLTYWVCAALVSIYAARTINRRATHKLPPRPKGLPFGGKLFQLSMRPWKEFEVWKKSGQYGKSTPYPPLLDILKAA